MTIPTEMTAVVISTPGGPEVLELRRLPVPQMGIGDVAIALSRLSGAEPIAVVSSAEKAAYARELGAIATIEHTREDFVARTRELTDGKGADRIVALAGGDMLARNIAAAARDATIVQLAAYGGEKSEIDAAHIVGKWLTILG